MARQKTTQAPAPPSLGEGVGGIAAAGVIALIVLAAYHNSFTVPFVLDDVPSIVDNPTIKLLWPLAGPLSPPRGSGLTVAGRPLLNLSLALNYSVSGLAVWSYHALNLAIHIGAALALFGILRRTFLQPRLRERFALRSTILAAAAALLWAVHPLQTVSVTYVIQRAESLCGLFYLLTLYAFIRGTTGVPSRPWLLASQAACLFGMATKEVAATVPLLVLLYDRTFVAGTFRAAWQRRRWYYLGLFAPWLLLAWLVASGEGRGGSAGFGSGISWWAYGLTQCHAIVHYLQLALWPYPLIFDYGTDLITEPAAVAPYAILLLVITIATMYALLHRPALAFLGVWFLAILAPTSSIVPVATQTVAEHRMYLPLAAVIVLAVVILDLLLGRWAAYAAALAALVLGMLTVQRNDVYRTPVSLWEDTVAKRPANPRARDNLGLALANAGRRAEALDQLAEAIRLKPSSVEYNNNFALVAADLGHLPEALALIDEVLRSSPGLAAAYDTKGHILKLMGRPAEAVESYEEAVRLMPSLAESHNDLGLVLVELGRLPEAASHYEAAIRIRPDYTEARSNLGAVRLRMEGDQGASVRPRPAP